MATGDTWMDSIAQNLIELKGRIRKCPVHSTVDTLARLRAIQKQFKQIDETIAGRLIVAGQTTEMKVIGNRFVALIVVSTRTTLDLDAMRKDFGDLISKYERAGTATSVRLGPNFNSPVV